MELVFNPLTCHYCCGRIPQRVILAIMLHLALQNSYNLRVVLNVAIVKMIPEPPITNTTELACPNYALQETHTQGGKFYWPVKTKALVLYSFYFGYILSQPPGGWLADKYGGRYVLVACIAMSALSNAIFPFSTQQGGYLAAVLLRGILGFAQGPVLPTISSIVSTWIPPQERTVLGGISYGGSNLGSILGSIFTGIIIDTYKEWPIAFYFWSGLSCVYILLHFMYVFSFPHTHPFIDDEEEEYITKYMTPKRKHKTPWAKIMTNVPFMANVCAQFGHNYIFFTLVTYLPTYMRDILQFNIADNGLYSALPFCALWISSLILSVSGNYLIFVLKCMTPHTFSKVFGTSSNMISAALALAAVYAGCNRELCISLYCISMVAKAFYYMTLPVNINELSKNHGGFMFGVCNGISSLSGIFGNALIGALTQNHRISEWKNAFWITFAISVVTSIIYIFWSSSERQDFDYEDFEERPPPTLD